MRRKHVAAGAALAGAAGLLLGACGGGDASSTADHGSPEGAVRGFAQALQGYDGSQASIDRILDWVIPSGRAAMRQFLPGSSQQGLTVRYQVKNFQVSGVSTHSTTADVSVSGELDVCGSGTVVGQQLNTCSPATDAFGNGSGNCLEAAQVSGSWYISGLCPQAAAPPGGSGTSPGQSGSRSGQSSPSPGG